MHPLDFGGVCHWTHNYYITNLETIYETNDIIMLHFQTLIPND